MNAVYTCNWYMEYRVHLCWGVNWEATFSWEKCCSPAGFDDWFAWDTFIRYHLSGMHIKTSEQFWIIKTLLLLTFFYTGSKWQGKKILNKHEKKATSSIWTKISKCRSLGSTSTSKIAGLWSKRPPNCWRGLLLYSKILFFFLWKFVLQYFFLL